MAEPVRTTRGMSVAQVGAVAAEVAARSGDRVRAVHQDGPDRFRVALEGPSGRTDLVVDLDPEFPRIHLATSGPAPASPSPLAASMRNALVGARVEGASGVRGE